LLIISTKNVFRNLTYRDYTRETERLY